MRVAYADPPYPGQAKRHYGGHPDYAGEVNQANLVAHLGEYDGWALSTSAAALPTVIALCPDNVRVAVWHRPNSAHPGNRGTWWWTWEPLIVRPARPPAITTKDFLSYHTEQGFLGSTIVGQKPRPFIEWMFALLGVETEDEFVDMFPGSGAVGRAWDSWRRQTTIFQVTQ